MIKVNSYQSIKHLFFSTRRQALRVGVCIFLIHSRPAKIINIGVYLSLRFLLSYTANINAKLREEKDSNIARLKMA
jgi:hypothetical protein